MINYIGKFLLVIFDIKKKPLCEVRLLFYYKASAFLPGYGFVAEIPQKAVSLSFAVCFGRRIDDCSCFAGSSMGFTPFKYI